MIIEINHNVTIIFQNLNEAMVMYMNSLVQKWSCTEILTFFEELLECFVVKLVGRQVVAHVFEKHFTMDVVVVVDWEVQLKSKTNEF